MTNRSPVPICPCRPAAPQPPHPFQCSTVHYRRPQYAVCSPFHLQQPALFIAVHVSNQLLEGPRGSCHSQAHPRFPPHAPREMILAVVMKLGTFRCGNGLEFCFLNQKFARVPFVGHFRATRWLSCGVMPLATPTSSPSPTPPSCGGQHFWIVLFLSLFLPSLEGSLFLWRPGPPMPTTLPGNGAVSGEGSPPLV
jgi:hypothetical protein